MKQKVLFMIFQGLSVVKNCLRPETILEIKIGLLCNFAKNFKGRHFMGQSGTGLKFSTAIDLYIFKTFFVQSFKKYVKNTYFRHK